MPPSVLTASQRRLEAARARRRRKALGPPLALSDLDMAVLTNVGPTDQPEATAFARDVSGQLAVDMLEAR